METPISDKMLAEEWPIFVETVLAKLNRGKVDYGDPSFALPASKVCSEIQAEMVDIMGWTFIQWCKLREMQRTLTQLELRP